MARTPFRFSPALALAAVLGACVSTRPVQVTQTWERRVAYLTSAEQWHMQGRAAAAIASLGWQANLDWRQNGREAAIRLSGPLGMGAVSLRLTPAGIVLDRSKDGDRPQANGSAVDANALIRERMGFTPPFDYLHYWLLGVPAPHFAFAVERNASDRAARLVQGDWSIEYTRYTAVGNDVLPAQLTLRHEDARVRIIVDHWDLGPSR